MNAELLKKSHEAIIRLYYNEPLPGNEKIAEAVLREAIKAFAAECHQLRTGVNAVCQEGEFKIGMLNAIESLEVQIRALIGD